MSEKNRLLESLTAKDRKELLSHSTLVDLAALPVENLSAARR